MKADIEGRVPVRTGGAMGGVLTRLSRSQIFCELDVDVGMTRSRVEQRDGGGASDGYRDMRSVVNQKFR